MVLWHQELLTNYSLETFHGLFLEVNYYQLNQLTIKLIANQFYRRIT